MGSGVKVLSSILGSGSWFTVFCFYLLVPWFCFGLGSVSSSDLDSLLGLFVSTPFLVWVGVLVSDIVSGSLLLLGLPPVVLCFSSSWGSVGGVCFVDVGSNVLPGALMFPPGLGFGFHGFQRFGVRNLALWLEPWLHVYLCPLRGCLSLLSFL